MKADNSRSELRQLWHDRVQAWQKSGKSILAWCREQNLEYRQFIYWKVRLLGKKQRTSNFVEIPSISSQNSVTLEISGFRIQISSC